MLPPVGAMRHYRTFEIANFLSTELHKSLSSMFLNGDEIVSAAEKIRLSKVFDELNRVLAAEDYLTGDDFTFVDAYAYNILTWAKPTGFDLTKWPNIHAFFERVHRRESVKKSLTTEGVSVK